MSPPIKPKIYHIVHVDRLASIIADGCLWCDVVISHRAALGTTIGMGNIKLRRLALPVGCYPGDHVGDYVPFYFCSRSVMLYLIYQANHPGLAYRGGQGPIIHLEADFHGVVDWANTAGRRWAFSLSNAGAAYAHFRNDLKELDQISWDAVDARDWRAPEVKEGKQAEFLVHESFPWHLVTRIGVRSRPVYDQVRETLKTACHRPRVEIKFDWYY